MSSCFSLERDIRFLLTTHKKKRKRKSSDMDDDHHHHQQQHHHHHHHSRFTTSNYQATSIFGDIDIADFEDELFDGGCWVHTTTSAADGSNKFQQQNNLPTHINAAALSLSGMDQAAVADNYFITNLNSCPHEQETPPYQEDATQRYNWDLILAPNTPSSSTTAAVQTKAKNHLDSPQFQQDQMHLQLAASSSPNLQSRQESGPLNTIWIAPKTIPGGPLSSVQERLMRAIWHFQTLNREKELLIQIWVPIRQGPKKFLTTVEQPHFYDPGSKSLLTYRTISEKYQFSADADSKECLGLPGRVFLGKFPEWTPDVRFFKKEEYPRVNDALLCDVRGSIALPVFERGSGNCLGVVEIVHTTQKINYRGEVESVCSALEAVDLRSSDVLTPFKKKDGSESSCNAELFEIFGIIRSVCDKHGLPLGQTWSLCIHNTKGGCWRSNVDKAHCASTVDSACYVRDQRVLGFHQACSEHHLRKGQGVVGNAFTTNQPCFATDLASCSKVDYPLSHHAKMFGINGSVAIRIRSTNNTAHCNMDYVLELFLPFNSCQDSSGFTFHLQVLESVSTAIQGSQNLRFLEASELQQEVNTSFPGNETTLLLSLAGGIGTQDGEDEGKSEPSSSRNPPCQDQESSWISNVVDPQRKGKEVAAHLSGGSQKEPRDIFRLTTTQWSNTEVESQRGIFADCGIRMSDDQDYGSSSFLEGSGVDNPSFGGNLPPGTKKVGAKRKTKTPKTISLPVLRQYFAGSLKDAARSIGVCPTTLKRICRQHGIERWPSRKIKKVGHSLKKLQMVMDSVQGAQGAIPLSSFYSSFPELSSSQNAAKVNDPPRQQKTLPESAIFSSGSQSSSSSHTSASGNSSSTGAKASPTLSNTNAVHNSGDPSIAEDPTGSLKRARSEPKLPMSNQESTVFLERCRSNKSLADHTCADIPHPPPLIPMRIKNSVPRAGPALKVKASFEEEKIRLTLTPDMGFASLRQEIAKRFSLEDYNKIHIKYLDDDTEWVLLTCDDDLDECIDIHRSSRSHTIKLSVHQVPL